MPEYISRLLFALPFLLALAAIPEAEAGVREEVDILCGATHPDDTQQRTQCRKRQLEAAGKVGRKIEKYKADPEIREIFERCVKPHRMEQGGLDWYRTNLCFDREARPYRNFKSIGNGAKDDTFTSKVLAFCRAKPTYRDPAFTWRERERCRRLQTVAGEEVAKLYQKAPAGSTMREGMDSCAREHRSEAGLYDWTTVKRCVQNFLRR